MRFILVIGFALFYFGAHSQVSNDYMTWVTVGADGKIMKGLKWSANFNARFNSEGVKKLFPQVGLEYKVTKWFRPGIEYRFIYDKNQYGNYKTSSSLRVNLGFQHVIDKRLKIGARLRYQYSTAHSINPEYDDGLDHLVRIKQAVSYDINDFFLTPDLSVEFFINPTSGIVTPGFTKIRYALGLRLDLKSPHSIKVKYRLDQRLTRLPEMRLRHIVGVSYGYSF